MTTLSLNISDQLLEQLQALARERQQPISDLAIEAIRKYVSVEQFRELRRRTVPFAQAQGFLTDDDVFRTIS